MRQLFAGLAIASLTIGVSAVSTVRLKANPTGSSHHLSTDVEILINGKPQPRYAHHGRVYVEAINGREYAIRLRNPYPVRVAVALSVDGLNTIDAQRTTAANARKWVLDPYETVTISGWQVSRTHARKFEFTTEENSYAQALGKGGNQGVISAVFFRERVAVSSTKVEPHSGLERGADQAERFRQSNEASAEARTAPQSAAPSAAPAPSLAGESMTESVQTRKAEQEYAATGMGDRTGHSVTFINLNLEHAAAQTIDIRYEYRDQLVRLGVLPRQVPFDPLARRERSRGFEAGFSPEVPTR